MGFTSVDEVFRDNDRSYGVELLLGQSGSRKAEKMAVQRKSLRIKNYMRVGV